METPFKRVAILGLGLIGGSLARAVAKNRPGCHIAGFDLSDMSLEYAEAEGFIHSRHPNPAKAVENADLVVLATPPGKLASLASEIVSAINPATVVTDVASVKRFAIAEITRVLPCGIAYVPGHPIAGGEQTGVKAGRADLFTGKQVILTPLEENLLSEPVLQVQAFWRAVGARVEYMPAHLHDRIYAYVSHLPQLIAFAARAFLPTMPAAADLSLRRFMRLIQSDPELWADIGIANSDYISDAIEDFTGFASQMLGELADAPEAEGEVENRATELSAQLIANCLIATVTLLEERTGVHPARYAGAGFADMTAPVLADPDATLAAISSHPRKVARQLEQALKALRLMHISLSQADRATLLQAMKMS